ncbi:MAG: winged helix-turn-helix domain-containing protein [Methanosarcinales archaeon]
MNMLSRIFGNSPQVKIVEKFVENYEDEISALNKSIIYRHIKKLLSEGIIHKTKKVGKTQLYKLNKENAKAEMILLLEKYMVSERLNKILNKKTFYRVYDAREIGEIET